MLGFGRTGKGEGMRFVELGETGGEMGWWGRE